VRLRNIFHNGRELGAGWRLLLFCLLVFVFGYAMHFVVKRLPLPEYPGLHPIGIIVDDAVLLLIALAATALVQHSALPGFLNRISHTPAQAILKVCGFGLTPAC